MSIFLKYREAVLALIIILMVVGIGIRAPAFVTPDSLIGVLNDTGFLFMMALAQMLVILTRGIDLSVAANLALTGMIVGMVNEVYPNLSPALYIAVALIVGAFLGLINGTLISGLKIPPIVVTLGTLAIYRGSIVVLAGGKQVNASEMSETFAGFPKIEFLGLNTVFWLAALIAVIIAIVLTRTRLGRGLFAVGGNPVAARYCGIDQARAELFVYVVAGAVAGLAGYLWVARYGVAYSEIAVGYELTVIAACVIGGVSIGGGVGTVTGTLLGALFIGVIVNSLPVMQVSPFWQMAISGAVILAAVIINARAETRPDKLILPEARRNAARGRA